MLPPEITNTLWAVAGVFLIVPFFFMDLKDAEKVEYEAMKTRRDRLLVYAAEKNCVFGEPKGIVKTPSVNNDNN